MANTLVVEAVTARPFRAVGMLLLVDHTSVATVYASLVARAESGGVQPPNTTIWVPLPIEAAAPPPTSPPRRVGIVLTDVHRSVEAVYFALARPGLGWLARM
jgi:hypothetical protein